jgi:hypothetical protein
VNNEPDTNVTLLRVGDEQAGVGVAVNVVVVVGVAVNVVVVVGVAVNVVVVVGVGSKEQGPCIDAEL